MPLVASPRGDGSTQLKVWDSRWEGTQGFTDGPWACGWLFPGPRKLLRLGRLLQQGVHGLLNLKVHSCLLGKG